MACLIGYKNGMSMSLVALGSPQNTLVVIEDSNNTNSYCNT